MKNNQPKYLLRKTKRMATLGTVMIGFVTIGAMTPVLADSVDTNTPTAVEGKAAEDKLMDTAEAEYLKMMAEADPLNDKVEDEKSMALAVVRVVDNGHAAVVGATVEFSTDGFSSGRQVMTDKDGFATLEVESGATVEARLAAVPDGYEYNMYVEKIDLNNKDAMKNSFISVDKKPVVSENGEVVTQPELEKMPLDKVPTYAENGEVVTQEALPEFKWSVGEGAIHEIEDMPLDKVPTYAENGEVVTQEALPVFKGELPKVDVAKGDTLPNTGVAAISIGSTVLAAMMAAAGVVVLKKKNDK